MPSTISRTFCVLTHEMLQQHSLHVVSEKTKAESIESSSSLGSCDQGMRGIPRSIKYLPHKHVGLGSDPRDSYKI